MLTDLQKSEFLRDGYVLLPGAVASDLVRSALHTINYQLGQGIPQEKLAEYRSRSSFPEIAGTDAIVNLFNKSGLLETMQDLIGADNVYPAKSAQLALRFPREPGSLPSPVQPHIDGLHTPTNGVPQGTLGSFTALVGVFLTDVTTEFAGNFTVWPGSHTAMEQYFRNHGLEELLNGRTPPVETAPPIQIQALAGDAVIAHYQLLHGVAANVAPYPRYAGFFRIQHPQHKEHRMDCLTDLWREWPGMRQLAHAD